MNQIQTRTIQDFDVDGEPREVEGHVVFEVDGERIVIDEDGNVMPVRWVVVGATDRIRRMEQEREREIGRGRSAWTRQIRRQQRIIAGVTR